MLGARGSASGSADTVDYELSNSSMSLRHALQRGLERSPQLIALRQLTNRSTNVENYSQYLELTYEQLDKLSDRIASKLLDERSMIGESCFRLS